jgi:DNA-binding NtrC family response regulator
MVKNEIISFASDRKRVLVIDDDKSILSSTSKGLEKNGFYVDTAETGRKPSKKPKCNITTWR